MIKEFIKNIFESKKPSGTHRELVEFSATYDDYVPIIFDSFELKETELLMNWKETGGVRLKTQNFMLLNEPNGLKFATIDGYIIEIKAKKEVKNV